MANTVIENEMTLRDMLRVFFEKIHVLGIVLIVTIISTFIGLQFCTPLYESKVKVLISAQKLIETPFYKEFVYAKGGDPVMTQREIVTSKAVLERTVRALSLDKRIPVMEGYYSPLKKYTLRGLKLIKSVMLFARKVKDAVCNLIFGKSPFIRREVTDFQEAVSFLKERIDIKRVLDADIFVINVSDYDPEWARKIANAVSRSYVAFDMEQQLAQLKVRFGEKYPLVHQLEDSVNGIISRLGENMSDFDAIGPASVKIVEQAVAAARPASPNKRLIFSLSAVVGIFLGLFFITLYAYFDQRFKLPQDVENYVGIPLLGSLPFSKNGHVDAPFEKAIGNVADQLYLMSQNGKLGTVLITSVSSGEGVTSTASKLARAISEHHGCKTLLIDCNFRLPEVDAAFRIPKSPGLNDIINDDEKSTDCIRKINDKLSVLPAGKTHLNPLIILNSLKMKEIIESLRSKFDLILLDVPPLKEFKDAHAAASLANTVLLVIDIQSAKKPVVKMFVDGFGEIHKISGAIFNKRRYAIPEGIYKYV